MADTQDEKVKGTLKEAAGKLLGDDERVKEGQAQQEKAASAEEAQQLEQEAAEKRQEAAGHKGQQVRNEE